MPATVLRERLLLVLFALGTNTGIKQVADGDHGHSEAALRHVRRLYVTRENLRRATVKLVNTTRAARDPQLWGAGTACASDSKKFGSWESNLMTEWHARYRGPVVMIYWHVERGRLCVYSQLKSCSSSEVAAMMEGLLHHGTDVPIEANYTDTHGASVIGSPSPTCSASRCYPGSSESAPPGSTCPTPSWPPSCPRFTRR